MKGDALDPKGLIYEAYRIEGITAAECRTIFMDWALSMPMDADTGATLAVLVAKYGENHPKDHPMTVVLTEGMNAKVAPRRRGGWRARSRD